MAGKMEKKHSRIFVGSEMTQFLCKSHFRFCINIDQKYKTLLFKFRVMSKKAGSVLYLQVCWEEKQ